MPRKFSAKYKLAILAEIEAASEKGQAGRILRREGLYSSLISEWRKQRDRGALGILGAGTFITGVFPHPWIGLARRAAELLASGP